MTSLQSYWQRWRVRTTETSAPTMIETTTKELLVTLRRIQRRFPREMPSGGAPQPEPVLDEVPQEEEPHQVVEPQAGPEVLP
jgi:hypothetical protein